MPSDDPFPRFRDETWRLPELDPSAKSYGILWEDVNGDGRPDLYLNHHADSPSQLFLSEGLRRFAPPTVHPRDRDDHGGFWLDLDRDGAPELLELTGGGYGVGTNRPKRSNSVFELEGDTLVPAEDDLGLARPLARARQALPLDLDRDGRLEILHGAVPRPDGLAPTTVFERTADGAFASAPWRLDAATEARWHFGLGRFDRSGELGLIGVGWNDPVLVRIEDGALRAGPPIPVGQRVSDMAVADFDGDGLSDVWLSNWIERNELVRLGPDAIAVAMVEAHDGSPSRLGFAAEGAVTFVPERETLDGPATLFVGAGSRAHPWGELRLSPDDPAVLGRPAALDDPGTKAVGLWRDAATGRWRVEIGKTGWVRFEADLIAEAPIKAVWISDDARPAPGRDVLLTADGRGGFDVSHPVPARSTWAVSAGDFDNDGDVDLHAVSGGRIEERRDHFYVNDGEGGFTAAWGRAPGPQAGRPHETAVVDFDADGRLDILSAAGRKTPPEDAGGAYRLYRNLGEAGHWLRLELDSALGDAVRLGAVATLASAHHRQVRIDDGGVRLRGQDDPVLHFGLGEDRRADLAIAWRDGRVDRARDLPADSHVSAWRGGEGDERRDGDPDVNLLFGAGGRDTLFGGAGDDRLHGGAGGDLLLGGAGQDRLRGGHRGDDLHGGLGRDTLLGEAGRDRLDGGGARDRLFGQGGQDDLFGGARADFLHGGPKADRLDGGRGPDALFGGHGRDVFVYDPVEGGRDRVLDWTEGADRIALLGVSGLPEIARDGADLVLTHAAGPGTLRLLDAAGAAPAPGDFLFEG